MSNLAKITCFLFDNGSRRPASTLALRRVANRLSDVIGCKVEPVSLLHSDSIAPAELAGQRARLLEESLQEFGEEAGKVAVALPLFFGPSGALHEYLPPRLEVLAGRYPDTRFILANCLESARDDSASILSQAIQREISSTVTAAEFSHPAVLVTDHGSPLIEVTRVRDRVGTNLARSWPTAQVASMERRDGPDYTFNEPLLETAVQTLAAKGEKEIIVALQFLFAGRHAGEGGDIAQICDTAVEKNPELRIATTQPIGESPEVLQLLERRFREAAV